MDTKKREDLRVRKTKQAIRNAFKEMICEMDLNEITIKELILVYALYQPSFVIDAYTRRFLSRLGFDFADDLEIQEFFETELLNDARIYGYFHWLVLGHCI